LYQEEIYSVPTPVIVVLPRVWHDILEDDRALLAKILGSVRISMDSVLIVTRNNISKDGLAALNPGKVLIFGVPVQEDIKPYEYIRLGSCEAIKADDLHQLDDAKKKSLWLALRKMFGV